VTLVTLASTTCRHGLVVRADLLVAAYWLPPCEICSGYTLMELRGVEDRGRRVRNARSVAVDRRIGGHDPPRFSDGLPGRYGRRLLPVCCPASDRKPARPLPTLGGPSTTTLRRLIGPSVVVGRGDVSGAGLTRSPLWSPRHHAGGSHY
jgi:hypothetical protein